MPVYTSNMFLDKKWGGIDLFIEWTLYIFIALFPFVIYQGYLFFDTSTRFINLVFIVEILAVSLGLSVVLNKRRLSIIKSPITLVLGLFLLILFISGINGLDFATSFWSKATRTSGLFYFLHLGVFYLFLLNIFKEESKIRNFIKIFLISAGFFSVGAFLSKDGLGLLFTSQNWQGFTFGNSTFAAMYLYAAFLLSIYYVTTSEKIQNKWWRFLIPMVFVINPYFINIDFLLGKINIFHNPFGLIGSAQASAFTALFSIILLSLIWLISKIKKINIRFSFLWGGITVGIFIAIFSVYSLLSSVGYLHKTYITGARPIVWELSQKAINDRPLLGWGSDNFTRVFELYNNNQLLEQKNGGEAWFDKAHNIFVDQTVDTGYLGMLVYILVYLVIIGCMVFVILKSKERNNQYLSVIIIVYFIGHLMELQTAFDTTISYIPFVIMASLAAIVFHKTYSIIYLNKKNEWYLSNNISYIVSGIFIVGSVYFFTIGTVPVMRAERTNGLIRTIGSSEKRIPLYPIIFNSKLDPGAFLFRASYDLQRGISKDPKIIEDVKKREWFKKELNIYVDGYVKYIESHPYDYRAHLDFANVYIFQRLFEVNNLDKAEVLLDKAIVLVPNTPQAYWMKAVAYLYQRNFDLAREWAKKAYDLNPGIEESQRVLNYINQSIKTFPMIDLYNFYKI